MLRLSTTKDKIDFKRYEDELNVDLASVFINKTQFTCKVSYIEAQQRLLTYDLNLEMGLLSRQTHRIVNKDSMIELLVSYGVDRKKFKAKNVSGLSLDSKKVIAPILTDFKNKNNPFSYTDIITFLENYQHMKRLGTLVGSGRNIFSRAEESQEVNRTGEPLRKVRFTYTRSQNNRYYTKNENIQAMGKEYLSCIQPPAGYVLVSADGSQADFREACEMLFLDNPEFAEFYHAEPTDKYKAIAKFIKARLGIPFDEEEYKESRKIYKELTLSTIYGKKDFSKSNLKNTSEAYELIKFIESSPKFKEYSTLIKNAIDFRTEVMATDIFGHVTVWPANAINVEEEVRNSPIQATTSAIVILWSMAIIDKFRSLGFTKDDFGILFNRHDEMVFYMKESLMEYSWIFKECSEVAIDDWDKLEFNPLFSYSYYTEDEDLRKLYEESVSKNKDKITPFTKGEPNPNGYSPTLRQCTVYTYSCVSAADYLNLAGYEGLDLTELNSFPRNQYREKNEYAKEILRELYKRTPEETFLHMQLSNYRKLNNKFVVMDNDNQIIHTAATYSELKKYLTEHRYGYVNVFNAVLGGDIARDGNIQFKYFKQSELTILNILNRVQFDKPYSEEETEFANVNVSSETNTSYFSDSPTTEVETIWNNITIYKDEMHSFEAPKVFVDISNLGGSLC